LYGVVVRSPRSLPVGRSLLRLFTWFDLRCWFRLRLRSCGLLTGPVIVRSLVPRLLPITPVVYVYGVWLVYRSFCLWVVLLGWLLLVGYVVRFVLVGCLPPFVVRYCSAVVDLVVGLLVTRCTVVVV